MYKRPKREKKFPFLVFMWVKEKFVGVPKTCAFGGPPAVTTPSKGRPGGRMSGLRNPSDTYTTSHQESHHGPAEMPSRQHHSNGGPSVRVEEPVSRYPCNAPDGNSALPRRSVDRPQRSRESVLADRVPHALLHPS